VTSAGLIWAKAHRRRFSSLGPLGTAEHPINQVLKFGLSSNAFPHEVVWWNFALDALSLRVGLVTNMQSAVVLTRYHQLSR
jgi:hypothetical protein